MYAFWASDERLLRSRSRLKRCVLPCMMPPFMLSAARAPAAPSHHWRVTDQGWSVDHWTVGSLIRDGRESEPAVATQPPPSSRLLSSCPMSSCPHGTPSRRRAPSPHTVLPTHPRPTCAASQTPRRDGGPSTPPTKLTQQEPFGTMHSASARPSLGTPQPRHAQGTARAWGALGSSRHAHRLCNLGVARRCLCLV